MSARRGRKSRRTAVFRTPAEDLELWGRAVQLSTEWQNHALSTAPADRPAVEDAITALYALLDRPAPEFVWVESPSAAEPLLPPPEPAQSTGPWPLEGQLANLVSALRERLDHRLDINRNLWSPPRHPDPVAALRSGVTLHSVLDFGMFAGLRRSVRESVANVVRAAIPGRLGLFWYGQHEADWIAHYDVYQRVVGDRFGGVDSAHLELWATLARSCGWWFPREDRCVIADRPSVVRTEPVPGSEYGEVRLHSATGPAVAFSDGWTLHSWHGRQVPSWVVEAPTVERIAAERNVEIRRCAIEHLGWTTFIDQAGLTVVGRAPDPGNPGSELHLYELPYQQWGQPTRLLLAVNGSVERDGTRRRYGLRVPPWFDDPIDAAGWSYGLTGAQYAQLQRRT